MREILFRGKRIDTGEWVYGYPVGWQNESGDISIVDSRFGACIDADGNLMMIEAPFPESIREAHRQGNWDALGGNYFPEFTVADHTCKPFPIPAHWKRYRAFDFGLDMFACLWVAVDENGRNYVYREYQKDNLIVSGAAEQAIQNTGISEKITATFAPPDMWNRQKDSGKSMAELFMLNGLPIIKANNNRVQGWLQVKEFLKPMGDGKPALVIFDTCNGLIESLREIQADETNPNDCAKEPHKITHISDALRYYCISRTMPTLAPTEEYARDEFDDYKVDPSTIGQFTGLTDKNGKKIFEGDTVRYKDALTNKMHCGVVNFADASFRITDGGFHGYRWQDYEVEVVKERHGEELDG